jgi:predicted TIM-barrel fold metal-dependent hydrolase
MDMAFIAAPKPGACKEDIDAQHASVLDLHRKFGDLVIPFFAVDPRRLDVMPALTAAIDRGFVGIKLYPNLGYAATDPRLEPVWAFADERRLPVMTHCSRGGLHGFDDRRRIRVTEDSAGDYGAPRLYEPILDRYRNLRLCLAHLGGQAEWLRFLQDPWYLPTPHENKVRPENKAPSWVADIRDMLHVYPNLYTDISYTIFYFQEFVPFLKVLLTDPLVRKRVLFGSDYYMADLESDNERLLSINLRAALGEELFWQIANANPQAYLFG